MTSIWAFEFFWSNKNLCRDNLELYLLRQRHRKAVLQRRKRMAQKWMPRRSRIGPASITTSAPKKNLRSTLPTVPEVPPVTKQKFQPYKVSRFFFASENFHWLWTNCRLWRSLRANRIKSIWNVSLELWNIWKRLELNHHLQLYHRYWLVLIVNLISILYKFRDLGENLCYSQAKQAANEGLDFITDRKIFWSQQEMPETCSVPQRSKLSTDSLIEFKKKLILKRDQC